MHSNTICFIQNFFEFFFWHSIISVHFTNYCFSRSLQICNFCIFILYFYYNVYTFNQFIIIIYLFLREREKNKKIKCEIFNKSHILYVCKLILIWPIFSIIFIIFNVIMISNHVSNIAQTNKFAVINLFSWNPTFKFWGINTLHIYIFI